ncbi:MAG: DUF4352 domain-containing protein [Brevundimonas sp.]|uniref:DUF4352 domain-containing protein n=1 Tax=Brevundimonas sp. TaxID=1871086 RepID=UPI002ABA6F58|nr:DUF4352 domain-containing protein [Brevundimonas sp.]MDZ4111709.1 DUF4352 domain-containing protein [Brevundimonas sp.]
MRVAVILVAVLLANCSPPAPAEPTPPSPDAVDTNIEFDDLTIEERADVGDPWALRPAAAGAVFVVVRFTVRNAGSTRAPMDLLPEVTLRDRNGRAVHHDPDATAVFRSEVNSGLSPARDGDLNPGVAFTGGLVFELAEDAWRAGGWQLHIEGAEKAIPLMASGTGR